MVPFCWSVSRRRVSSLKLRLKLKMFWNSSRECCDVEKFKFGSFFFQTHLCRIFHKYFAVIGKFSEQSCYTSNVSLLGICPLFRFGNILSTCNYEQWTPLEDTNNRNTCAELTVSCWNCSCCCSCTCFHNCCSFAIWVLTDTTAIFDCYINSLVKWLFFKLGSWKKCRKAKYLDECKLMVFDIILIVCSFQEECKLFNICRNVKNPL